MADTSGRALTLIENYIYFYHTDTFIVIPSFADSVTDTMSANFVETRPLGRSAPIYSYAGSGPRSIQVAFNLHRDLMKDINYNVSNAEFDELYDDDYTDIMIRQIQACVVPNYDSSSKMVNPPLVALRLGNDIFIKGIVNGACSITYKYPVLKDGRYSNVDVGFTVTEVDPWSASQILDMGSFRGLDTTLERY